MNVGNIYFDDIDLEIMTRESVLDQSLLNKEISNGLNMFNEMTLFESAEDSEAKDGVLVRIGKTISTLIQSIIDYVERFFKSISANVGKKLSVDDYMTSDTAKIRLNADMKKIYEETEKQLFEGHKFLNMLYKKTGIEPRVLNKWSDKVSSFVIENGGTILSTAASVTLANAIHQSLTNNNEKLKNLQKENDRLVDEMNKLEADRLKEDGHTIMSQIHTVINGLSTISRRYTRMYSSIEGQLKQYKKSYKEKKNKKK